jgi:hypothetical protein
MSRELWDSFCTMRNDINMLIGDMRSSESTLLEGPEMVHECTAVVEAIAKYVDSAKAEIETLRSALIEIRDDPTSDIEGTRAYAARVLDNPGNHK